MRCKHKHCTPLFLQDTFANIILLHTMLSFTMNTRLKMLRNRRLENITLNAFEYNCKARKSCCTRHKNTRACTIISYNTISCNSGYSVKKSIQLVDMYSLISQRVYTSHISSTYTGIKVVQSVK